MHIECMTARAIADLHEVEESIVSEEKVKESEFAAGDVLKLIVAKLMTRQESWVVSEGKISFTHHA